MPEKKKEPQDFDPEMLPPFAAPMPSLVGISPEQLQTILGALGKTSAEAMREAYRQQRRENPNYPERSIFNPAGLFDDAGQAVAPKVKLAQPTFFVGVRLNEELMTVEEVELCNRFTESKVSRDGLWKVDLEGQGRTARLKIDVPCKTVDDRMVLPPFTHILRELLSGTDAVSPDALQKRVEALEAELKAIRHEPAA